MYSFDKLALLIVSLICLGCVMHIGLMPGPATANATMLMGGLMGFLGSASAFMFTMLRSDTKNASMPPVAPPVVAPVVPQQTEPVIPATPPVQ